MAETQVVRVPLGSINGVRRELFSEGRKALSPGGGVLRKVLGTPPARTVKPSPIPSRRRSVEFDESVEALLQIDLGSATADAEILREAVTSTRKARRESLVASPSPIHRSIEVSASPRQEPWAEAVTSLERDIRDRLAVAMLRLFNQADEEELCDLLSGIGKIRAKRIVQARAQRSTPFESVPQALVDLGLSAKHIENIIVANMKHILLHSRAA